MLDERRSEGFAREIREHIDEDPAIQERDDSLEGLRSLARHLIQTSEELKQNYIENNIDD
jgi:hypothetical protein